MEIKKSNGILLSTEMKKVGKTLLEITVALTLGGHKRSRSQKLPFECPALFVHFTFFYIT